jgi:hypothetical protein
MFRKLQMIQRKALLIKDKTIELSADIAKENLQAIALIST